MAQEFFRGCNHDRKALADMVDAIGDAHIQITEDPYGIYTDSRNGKQYVVYKATLANGQIIYLSANLREGMMRRNILTRIDEGDAQ